MLFDELRGRSVVVWGAGREGRATWDALARVGIDARVAVTGDGSVPDDLHEVAVSGPAALTCLEAADVVVKSPGIPKTGADYQHLAATGVEITSLMALWLRANSDRVIAVTGTKGKSTTSAVIQHVVEATGLSAALVGNVGTPVTSEAAERSEVAVVEVSSYQAAEVDVSPRIAVVTSLYPEHLPWHGGFEQYVHDKLNLVAHGASYVVVPDDNPDLLAALARRVDATTTIHTPGDFGIEVVGGTLRWQGVGELESARIPLRGSHNLANITLALAAATIRCSPSDTMRAAMLASLETLRPLEHRLERVPSGDDRLWIDDSLATAPEAVVAALQTFEGQRVTLIAGGADRGLAFDPLVSYLCVVPTPVTVLLVGPAGRRLLEDLQATGLDGHLARDFDDALAQARSSTSDVVLLSPGAPSFDEFASYEERSAAFARGALVKPAPASQSTP